MPEIYTVTVFSDMSHTRCVGFFYKLEDALSVLENNECDVYEYNNDYAVIEKFSQGLYPLGKLVNFFEYDEEKDGYVACEVPKGYERVINFAMG
jgi:hypothetical protein